MHEPVLHRYTLDMNSFIINETRVSQLGIFALNQVTSNGIVDL